MKMRSVVVGLALVLTSAPAVAMAQQETAEKSDVSFTLGTRAWGTTGYTKWNYRAPLVLGGPTINPISELRWRGVDSVVPEINAELVWKRLVLLGSAGGGRISEGVLIDDDFALSDRQGRFSHTRSSVNDDGLFYANADIGLRLGTWGGSEKTRPGYADLFVGYQYWHEKYEAFGATGFPSTVPSGVKAITEDYFWHSVRVGVRQQAPIYEGLSFRTKAVWLPWSSSRLEDVHHLRPDLAKNPSVLSEATGGFGFQLDGGLVYNIWRGLSVEAGYQYWRIDSGRGDTTIFSLTTGTMTFKLNEIISERHGPYFGLQYRF